MKLSRRSFLLGTAGAAVAAAVPGLPHQRALGGVVSPGTYMVGSGGPELFVPTLIDPMNLVYQVNDGPVRAILAVQDRPGEVLTPDLEHAGDYPDEAALRAAEIPYGHFATCVREGKLRLLAQNDATRLSVEALV